MSDLYNCLEKNHQQNLVWKNNNLMKYEIKDYYYGKDVAVKIINQAINKNIANIVSFNVELFYLCV